MKKILLIIAILLSVVVSPAHGIDDPKYKITPTQDSNSPTGVYIPIDLDDCFKELQKMLHPDFLKEIKSKNEEDRALYHFGLGMWLRNNWGLWSGSRLKKHFNEMIPHHKT